LSLHFTDAAVKSVVTYPSRQSRHEGDPFLVDVIIAAGSKEVHVLRDYFSFIRELDQPVQLLGCWPETPVVFFVHEFGEKPRDPHPGEIPIYSFYWATGKGIGQVGDDRFPDPSGGGGGPILTEARVKGPFVGEIVCILHAIAGAMDFDEVGIVSESDLNPFTSLIVLEDTIFVRLHVQSSPEGEIEYSPIPSFSDWDFTTE
jgi:hypothetical protein